MQAAEAEPAPGHPRSAHGKTRVVVLGSGWGAIPFLKGLSKEACASTYDVTVVSPRNYFLYTPLLPGAPCRFSCSDAALVAGSASCAQAGG